ncbi:MAG TPA: hypothetical protein ENH15_00895 [Actinobacteria bacterium]|nr:hypothetical protein [Actinomycetota bacterium]
MVEAEPTTTTTTSTQTPAADNSADGSGSGQDPDQAGAERVALPSPGDIIDGVANEDAPLLVAGFAIAGLLTIVGAVKAFVAARAG